MSAEQRRQIPHAGFHERRNSLIGRLHLLVIMSTLLLLTAGTAQAVIDPAKAYKLMPGADGEKHSPFGRSVSLSADGRTALVGYTGSAYVFIRNADGSWIQQAKLKIYDNESAAVFLSADGNTALIGGYGPSQFDYLSTASAHVFIRAPDGRWSKQAKLAPDGWWTGWLDSMMGFFGRTVCLSADGNTALVSGRDEFYVFTRVANGTWRQQAEIPITSAWFVSLSADGGTAMFGGGHEQIGNTYRAVSRIFVRGGGGSWREQQAHVATDDLVLESFGDSVSLSADGNTALFGAWDKNFTGMGFIYSRSGGKWSQQATLTAVRPHDRAYSNLAVSLSADGGTALIGVNSLDTAEVYIFTGSGTAWTQRAKLTRETYGFGCSASLSADGTTALIGTKEGAAYVFTESAPPKP